MLSENKCLIRFIRDMRYIKIDFIARHGFIDENNHTEKNDKACCIFVQMLGRIRQYALTS